MDHLEFGESTSAGVVALEDAEKSPKGVDGVMLLEESQKAPCVNVLEIGLGAPARSI